MNSSMFVRNGSGMLCRFLQIPSRFRVFMKLSQIAWPYGFAGRLVLATMPYFRQRPAAVSAKALTSLKARE
jgi:hypothetical protein